MVFFEVRKEHQLYYWNLDLTHMENKVELFVSFIMQMKSCY